MVCIRFTAPTPLPLLGRQFDLVGLQEVDVGVKRSGRVHEVRRVAESIASSDEFSALPGADRLKVREAFLDEQLQCGGGELGGAVFLATLPARLVLGGLSGHGLLTDWIVSNLANN